MRFAAGCLLDLATVASSAAFLPFVLQVQDSYSVCTPTSGCA